MSGLFLAYVYLHLEVLIFMYELPKKSIFCDKKIFNNVYTKGCSYSNRLIVIHVMRSNKINGEVGFTVGKKVGNAVIRNRIKRLMRETYRLCQYEIQSDVKIILIGRKTLINSNCNDVIKAFKDVCLKAKILKRSSYH